MAVTNPRAGGGTARSYVLQGPDGASAEVSELREGFRQGFVFELIDLDRPGQPLRVHVLVLNPTRYTLTEPHQGTLTPAGRNSVVSEENGIILRDITIEGTFGLSKKSARGFQGAQGGGAALSGTSHFSELRSLFRYYSALKKDPDRSARIKLIFHALRDDDHFVVMTPTFETPRDNARSRVHYTYRITMKAIGADTSYLRALATEGSRLDRLTSALESINQAFQDARGAFAEVTAGVAEVRRYVGNVEAILTNAAQFINAVGGFVRGVTTLIKYPAQLAATGADNLASAADDLADALSGTPEDIRHEYARSLRRLEASFDQILQFDDKFEDAWDDLAGQYEGARSTSRNDYLDVTPDGLPGPGGATLATRTRVAAGSGGLAGLDLPRGRALRPVTLQRTDSLETIAIAAGTTPEVLILLNELEAPYLAPEGGPGLLKPGDVLLVPASASEASAPNGLRDYLSPEDVLYGIDFAIDPAALKQGKLDFLIDEVHGASDFVLARGVPNVLQGIEITLHTEKGTTQFLPEVGIRRNVGVRGTLQHVLLASLTLREALLSDSRVTEIESSRVVLDKDVLSQEVTAVLGGSRPATSIVLPFGTAASG